MDTLNALMNGFGDALTPTALAAALIGALLGTAIGVLPGMSPTVAIAILLVPSMQLDGIDGLVLLTAVFFGTQYGDSLSAILMNVPSEAPAAVIARAGYPLARAGKAGPALAIAATASFAGAITGLIGLGLFAGLLSDFVFNFGPIEITTLIFFGIIALCRIAEGSLPKLLVALGIGLMIPTVGFDPIDTIPRFTMGATTLLQGFSLVPVVLGLIGMAELMEIAIDPTARKPVKVGRGLRALLPERAQWRAAGPASARGSVIGFIFGLIPGPSLSLASFASYRAERTLAKNRAEFDRGSFAGVAGPKAADDAAVSANIASLLTIGIPFTPVTGVLYAGFLLHGLHPGPLLIKDSPDEFWKLVAAMAIGNLALLVLNFPMVGIWIQLLKIPQRFLAAVLALLILIGSFSLRNSALDMLVTVIAGVVGYGLKRIGVDRIVLIVGLLLGPLLEDNFRQTMGLSGGDLGIFLDRPISLGLLILTVLVLVVPLLFGVARKGDTEPLLELPATTVPGDVPSDQTKKETE
jgi:putative tricarboxylic transport membrane protein